MLGIVLVKLMHLYTYSSIFTTSISIYRVLGMAGGGSRIPPSMKGCNLRGLGKVLRKWPRVGSGAKKTSPQPNLAFS